MPPDRAILKKEEEKNTTCPTMPYVCLYKRPVDLEGKGLGPES